MRYKDWEKYEDSYEKPKKMTKKKKTWKQLKEEKNKTKHKWNKKKGVKK